MLIVDYAQIFFVMYKMNGFLKISKGKNDIKLLLTRHFHKNILQIFRTVCFSLCNDNPIYGFGPSINPLAEFFGHYQGEE